MDAADFNGLFGAEVAAPLLSLGGLQDGQSLFWESDHLTVALLRTEPRFMPPPQLTLCVRHRAMRTLEEDELPTLPSKRPSDYPLKLLPSDVRSLLDPAFRYAPYNLGRYPQETFDYAAGSARSLRQRLVDLGQELCSTVPELDQELTPERLLRHLVDEGEDAWCERMWIEDLQAIID